MGIEEFVKKALEKGYSEKEVYDIFSKKGYSEKEINKAIENMNEKNPSKEKNYSEVSMLGRVGLLFSNPTSVFKSFKDGGIGKSLILFLIVSAIYLAAVYGLQAILSIGGGFGQMYGLMGMGYFFGFAGAIFILVFVSTFIYSGMSHLILKLMGGQGRYFDTYNVYTYSAIPAMLIAMLPIIGIIGFVYSIIIMIFGFKEYHNVSTGKAVTAAILPLLIFIGLFIALLFYVFFAFRIY